MSLPLLPARVYLVTGLKSSVTVCLSPRTLMCVWLVTGGVIRKRDDGGLCGEKRGRSPPIHLISTVSILLISFFICLLVHEAATFNSSIAVPNS